MMTTLRTRYRLRHFPGDHQLMRSWSRITQARASRKLTIPCWRKECSCYLFSDYTLLYSNYKIGFVAYQSALEESRRLHLWGKHRLFVVSLCSLFMAHKVYILRLHHQYSQLPLVQPQVHLDLRLLLDPWPLL